MATARLVNAPNNAALCAAWLDWQSKRCKPLTVRQYAQRLDKLVAYAGDRPLANLSLTDLEAWTHQGTERKGSARADGSIDRDVVIVRGLFKWAYAHGLINRNVALDLTAPPVRNHNPRPLDDKVWRTVWEAELSREMRVFLGLGYYCGLRREEVCRLTARHWDSARGRLVHFPRKGDRNSKTTGVFPVVSCARLFAEKRPDLLADPEDFLGPLRGCVEAACSSDGGFVLPWGERRLRGSVRFEAGQTNPDQINSRLVGLLGRLGLPDRVFTPHALRHSFATNLLDMGVPLHEVSVLANHSSIAITQRYVKVSDDPLAKHLDGSLADRWLR